MNTTPAFWQQISGIAVINLDHRADRWHEVSTQAAKIPGQPAVTRIAACLGTALPGFGTRPWFRGRKTDMRWAARAGCVASHRRVMQQAQASGWQTTLVLEDDCDLAPLMTCDLDALHRVLFVEHPDWDVCYLGHNEIYPPSQRVASWSPAGEIMRVAGCATTHAYLVRERARDWIIAQTPGEDAPWPWVSRHRAIDRWYGHVLSRHFSVFACAPALLLQKTGYSDIGLHQVDWEQMEMVAAVPVQSGFRCKLRMTHLRARFTDVGDVLRSLWIRIHGF